MSELLTADTAGAYVAARLASMPGAPLGREGLVAREIGGGNLNYAFRVTDASGSSVFVKQAPDFIKVLGREAKLHRERLRLEVQVLRRMEDLLAGRAREFLPTLHLFDEEGMVFVSDFLESHRLLQECLFAGEADEQIASKLGEFMGLLHSRTHSTKVTQAEAHRMAADYANPVLRDVQLEYVFSKCFREDERAKHLREDGNFMAELEKLKDEYRGLDKGNLSLLHGDLHAGSVMADGASGDVKVIDPEFCIYGPPGLDVGSLLSTYALAYCFHQASDSSVCGEPLKRAMDKVWSSYVSTMSAGGVGPDLVQAIGRQAAGFAGAEVARTALGMAYERSLKLPDPAARAEAELQALEVGAACIVGRHQGLEVLMDAIGRYGGRK